MMEWQSILRFCTLTRTACGSIAVALPAVLALSGCAGATDPADTSVFLEIPKLHAQCGVPGPCGQALACEGKVVSAKGQLDQANVFDRKRYPSLPYEKFTLVDKPSGAGIEVWAVSAQNDAIFAKLGSEHSTPAVVSVRGRAVGVDQPITGRCSRTVKLEITSPQDLATSKVN